MTEAELQQTVLEAARLRGWHASHFRPARVTDGWRTPLAGEPGFPDLVLARAGDVLALELKAERGRPSAAQVMWLDALGAGAPAVLRSALVRPEQLDAVLRLLRTGVRELPPELEELFTERERAPE